MTILSFISLCFLASLLELDATYAFQTLLCRPIIAGPIFGIAIGNAMAGLQVGIFAELLLLDISPLGGIVPPSGVVATAVPILLYAMGIELYFGFFLGIVAAIFYSFFDALLRKSRFTWLIFVEKKISRQPTDIKHVIAGALLLSFSMTFVFISVVSWVCSQLMLMLHPHLTARTHFACQLAYTAVPWIGLAGLIPAFRFKAR